MCREGMGMRTGIYRVQPRSVGASWDVELAKNMAVNPIFGSSCKSSKVASAPNCWATTTPATYNAVKTKGRVLLCSPDRTEFFNEEWASLELTEIDLAQYFSR